jgi:uncharacterized protein (TIGR03437 family)
MKEHFFNTIGCAIALSLLLSVCCEAQPIPSIAANGVLSASAFGGFSSIAPGSWIEIYGSNLAVDTRGWANSDFNGGTAPTSLDGTSVTIGGQAAFVDYISAGQVNVQVPSNVASGLQQVIVTVKNTNSAPVTVTVNATQPGILAPTSFNVGGKQYAVAVFSDGAYVLPPGTIAGLNSRRAHPGDTITFYGVGFGPVIPSIPAGQIVQGNNSLSASFQISFGSSLAAVTYDGLAPSAVGLYQFNVVVPTIPNSDSVPVTFTLGGKAGTQTLFTSVQNGSLAPQLQSLTLSSSSVTGGGTVQGTVMLSTAAPAGGSLVTLSSNSAAASVPQTVSVPAGATSATFTISTSTVSSAQSATITANYDGNSVATVLTLNPSSASQPPFSQLAITVTFQPSGYPSSGLSWLLEPENGESTFAVTIYPILNLVHCVASNGNLTFTCNTLAQVPEVFSDTFNTLLASSVSLVFTLAPGADPPYTGGVSGMLSVTGTMGTSTAMVTLAGSITGYYY